MPCYSPLKGYRAAKLNSSGRRPIVFKPAEAFIGGAKISQVQIPCGQCIGCRLERSRQWAIRCVHESQLHEKNCFITLTFRQACPWWPAQRPADRVDPTYSLHKFYVQDFMKRLRFKFAGSHKSGIRYFHCGEYGEEFERPHHHACLFNFDFPDKYFWKNSGGFPLYRSPILEELWPHGYSSIGACTFETAAYVARYVTKKINGKMAAGHYGSRLPEYVTMSRRPGIAHGWLQKYASDVYPADSIIIRNNLKCKPPKYYDKMFDLTNPGDFRNVKRERIIRARDNPDNTPERLEVRHKIQQLRAKKLKRGYELNETTSIKIIVSQETIGASGSKISTKKVIKYQLKTREKTLKQRIKKCKNSTSIPSSMTKLEPSRRPSTSAMMEKLFGPSPIWLETTNPESVLTPETSNSTASGPSRTQPAS